MSIWPRHSPDQPCGRWGARSSSAHGWQRRRRDALRANSAFRTLTARRSRGTCRFTGDCRMRHEGQPRWADPSVPCRDRHLRRRRPQCDGCDEAACRRAGLSPAHRPARSAGTSRSGPFICTLLGLQDRKSPISDGALVHEGVEAPLGRELDLRALSSSRGAIRRRRRCKSR